MWKFSWEVFQIEDIPMKFQEIYQEILDRKFLTKLWIKIHFQIVGMGGPITGLRYKGSLGDISLIVKSCKKYHLLDYVLNDQIW